MQAVTQMVKEHSDPPIGANIACDPVALTIALTPSGELARLPTVTIV